MQRPDIQKTSVDLKYGIDPNSAANNYTATISDEENNKIHQWVNSNYGLYSEDYKAAVYKDAYDAVLARKTENEKNAIKERERKEKKEKANYIGNDITQQQEKQLATAQIAISDAADIIRKCQRANGLNVDMSLTDKETVNKFLEINTEKLYAEYVMKFLDTQVNGFNKEKYGNEWLASKLGLDTGTTFGIDNRKLYNARDKLEAGLKGGMQGTADLAQKTMGRVADWAGSNIGAGLGELGYWTADKLGADVSEGTVWDKLKQAEGHSRKESKQEASSEDLRKKGVSEEDMGAFNIGREAGQLATEMAILAPLEGIGGAAIGLSKMPTAAKWLSHAANAGLSGAAFQGLDDISNGEWSKFSDYLWNAGLGMASGGILNGVGKLWNAITKKGGVRLFGAAGRDENAILKRSSDEWKDMSNVSQSWDKDPNVKETPRTRIGDELSVGKQATSKGRTQAGQRVEYVENMLEYEGKKYDANNIFRDIEKEFNKLKGGENAKLPKFGKEGNKIVIDDAGKETLNKTAITDGNNTIKLGDEIQNALDNVFNTFDNEINATNTKRFIDKLESILGNKGWDKSDKGIRAMRSALKQINEKFDKSLTKASRIKMKNANKLSAKAQELDKKMDALVGILKGSDIDKVAAAESAIGNSAAREQLFKDIKDVYGIDLNNIVLSWAYNVGLYSPKKASRIIEFFYPSKAGFYEAIIQSILPSLRRKAAQYQIDKGIKLADMGPTNTPISNAIGGSTAEGIYTANEDRGNKD